MSKFAKITILGYENHISPIYEIRDWFTKNGYDLTNKNPDVIIELCGFYHRALEIASKNPKALKIFNLLDCAPANTVWPAQMVKEQLSEADIVTTISETSARFIKQRIDVNCDIIYYPVKNLFFEQNRYPLNRNNEFLFVGRILDPIKNSSVVLNFIKSENKKLICITPDVLNFPIERLKSSGVEIYQNIGLQELINFYLNTKFLLFPSKIEGLGLPPIEAIICGTIPILNVENKCAEEFGLEDFACSANTPSIFDKITEINKSPGEFQNKIETLKKQYNKIFSVEAFCKRLISYFK